MSDTDIQKQSGKNPDSNRPTDLVSLLRNHAVAWGVAADTPDDKVFNETGMARDCARAAVEIEALEGYLRNIELATARREWELVRELVEMWASRPVFPSEPLPALKDLNHGT